MIDAFNELWVLGLHQGVKVTGLVILTILFIGLIRFAKKYALAEQITIDDEFMYSCFLIRLFYSSLVFVGLETDSKEELKKPYGADPRGILADILISAVAILSITLLWPIFIAATILFVAVFLPLHASHKYFKKRKDFVNLLKNGKEAEI